jgi:hypothetical protein
MNQRPSRDELEEQAEALTLELSEAHAPAHWFVSVAIFPDQEPVWSAERRSSPPVRESSLTRSGLRRAVAAAEERLAASPTSGPAVFDGIQNTSAHAQGGTTNG